MGLTVILCTGEGAREAVIDIPMSDSQGEHGGDRSLQSVTCPFFGLSTPALAADVPRELLPGPGLFHEIAQPPPLQVEVAARPFALPPLRGPPLAS